MALLRGRYRYAAHVRLAGRHDDAPAGLQGVRRGAPRLDADERASRQRPDDEDAVIRAPVEDDVARTRAGEPGARGPVIEKVEVDLAGAEVDAGKRLARAGDVVPRGRGVGGHPRHRLVWDLEVGVDAQ